MQELKITNPNLLGMKETVEALKIYSSQSSENNVGLYSVTNKKEYLFMMNNDDSRLIGMIVFLDVNIENRVAHDEMVKEKGYNSDSVLIDVSDLNLI